MAWLLSHHPMRSCRPTIAQLAACTCRRSAAALWALPAAQAAPVAAPALAVAAVAVGTAVVVAPVTAASAAPTPTARRSLCLCATRAAAAGALRGVCPARAVLPVPPLHHHRFTLVPPVHCPFASKQMCLPGPSAPMPSCAVMANAFRVFIVNRCPIHHLHLACPFCLC